MHNFSFINEWYRAKEATVVKTLLKELDSNDADHEKVRQQTIELIHQIRALPQHASLVAKLMQQFKLSSPQGLTLMAMAESLLRIPDAETQDKLIAEKLSQGSWGEDTDGSENYLSKLSKLALKTSQSVLSESSNTGVSGFFKKALHKTGAPIIRQSVIQMISQLADEFILGSSMDKSLVKAKILEAKGYRYSYDMLGEAALTAEDAAKYLASYKHAIHALARISNGKDSQQSPSISVKLSALHPRYKHAQKHNVLQELTPKVLDLARLCKESDIAMTIDAEEAEVLELTLNIISRLAESPELANWNGLGLVVQAYQKRALRLTEWAIELAKKTGKIMNIRLVKGAYWDTEIKLAQEKGFDDYPVFTQKYHTDLSYLCCAKKLLENRSFVYPQFATHNAGSAIHILNLAQDLNGFEFQKLHGMGDGLYEALHATHPHVPCRIYAPVGEYNDLLPYLVRRILENGANTSFVHHLTDPNVSVEQLAQDPIRAAKENEGKPHPKITLPRHIYSGHRKNSIGLDLSDDMQLQSIYEELETNRRWESGPIIGGESLHTGHKDTVVNPALHTDHVGDVYWASAENVEKAFDLSEAAFENWTRTPVEMRADCLEKLANLMEENYPKLISLCIREAGKTIPDAVSEVREAVDFCRYYALNACENFAHPTELKGYTGERNLLSLHGRGTFVCISPWNFPLAIFTGQVTAALVAGNCVIAKPSSDTPLIAAFAVKLMYEAGIPQNVLHLVPGKSSDISQALIEDPRLSGIALTGSMETARQIQGQLATSQGPIIPLIAETGGQNAMIVDSSALPEQVVKDIISSAFQSAGQRCSALRVMFIQEDIADKVLEMLSGAMQELHMGNPAKLAHDIGPVINARAKNALEDHVHQLSKLAKKIYQLDPPHDLQDGTFVAPAAFELKDLSLLTEEHFGPILHVLRYKSSELDTVIDRINSLKYGLTLGIHSRIEKTCQHIFDRVRVGNVYVNRSMIGAVVGVQPFGGEGLSGTGPKAGGPHYLHRFVTERSQSINTTAMGGNASLMTME
ncbi:MAG: bifunctional proline dehydrogenase/L-glutamate gamma-semialdehyde dehydrogenase PutA [Alphaproteobacteria bacterium]|nr:bifunctional proline dehydrogenase/L-glutamate gamma-semialdehyde dehydrogenase PutA [Alphaproteobacteria bacterium]